jgi:4'-phosphopantetheinyl transferase
MRIRVIGEKAVSLKWQSPGTLFPVLAAGEVHVWRTAVRWHAPFAGALWQLLADDERLRALAYRREEDRQVFVTGRALLRSLLARYAGRGAKDLGFCRNEHGKPALLASGIHFNVAHAGDWLVYAFSRNSVGIDIEAIDDRPETEQIAEELFSRSEREQLRNLPANERQAAFFQGWVRKEAYVKALGLGLAVPLDAFAVSLTGHEPARLLRPWSGDPLGHSWWLTPLDLGRDYAGAVAATTARLWCWDWQPEGAANRDS